MKDTRIVIAENMYSAEAFTHAGTFHADEVMATAIIAEAHHSQKLHILRVNDMNGIYPSPASIVYDIGGGSYDHHQKGGNGARENGVPYSSCGLIWRDFGRQIISQESTRYPELVWKIVDESLISGIDAIDCGTYPKADYPCGAFTVSSAIGAMNPNWDESSSIASDRFLEAVSFARTVFRNTLRGARSKARAYDVVVDALRKSNCRVMLLDHFVPWIEFIFSMEDPDLQALADELLYVIYPNPRGGYQWRVVPKEPGSFEQRNHVPTEWLGLRDKELQTVTGISTATFVHPNGFTGGAEKLSDAMEMVELAMKNEA